MAVTPDSLFRTELLLHRGGWVLWAILAASCLMWALILERYYFLRVRYPGYLRALIAQWQRRRERRSWYAQRIRQGMIAEAAGGLRRHLLSIQTLTGVLPMLGLLGTVIGMVQVFDTMTAFGSGHVRRFASGIATALVTTIAGLVTALPGLYFSANLEHRVARAIHHTADSLRRE